MVMLENASLDLSIIMPCQNEENTVGLCIQDAFSFLNRNHLQGEILIVDNNSSDRSGEIALQCGARVISEPRFGYGNALRTGISNSRGRVLILGDCDTTYDFLHLEEMYHMLSEQNYDMVIGNRYTGGMEQGSMPLSHWYGVRFLSLCGRFRFHTDVYDFHCGLRGLTRKAAENLNLQTEGMEFSTEMIAQAANHSLSIGQLPVPLKKCNYKRSSKLRTIQDGCRHLKYILQTGGQKMNKSTIQKRKRRFWAFSMAVLLTLSSFKSLKAEAIYVTGDPDSDKVYFWTTPDADTKEGIEQPQALQPETELFIEMPNTLFVGVTPSITYLDAKQNSFFEEQISNEQINNGIYSTTVKSYEDLDNFSDIPDGHFKEWSVKSVQGSSGYFYTLYLVAVEYEEHTIEYKLNDDETNSEQNITSYLEGKTEFTLLPAEKEGYEFEGWFTDQKLTTEIKEITPSTIGDLTLYPKFTPKNYSITYETYGGTNSEKNPSSYTCGIGVTSFFDASKTDHNFDGWFLDEDFKTPVTSISKTEHNEITLFAKFTAIVVPDNKDETVDDDLDNKADAAGNDDLDSKADIAGNDDSENKEVVADNKENSAPQTGDHTSVVALMCMFALSGFAILYFKRKYQ